MVFGVIGPTLRLRLPEEADAPALFRLASDPEVTRWFSWGPYTREEEALAYVRRLPAQRERGEQLDLLIDHREHGPIGITGLSEFSRRDRRAVVGSWLGRAHWGTGANSEAKALVAHLGFGPLGLERIGSYANVDNARSQAALRKVGFRHEGVLRRFHRHGDQVFDVASFSLLADEWRASPLAEVPVRFEGEVPPAFVP